MASVVQICNLALTRLGEDQIISLTEDSKAARLCNLHFEPLRDAVLRDHIWNFALSRAELALSTSSPVFGYAYKFALPTDCVRVVKQQYEDVEYKIEGGFLLSDDSASKILYVKRETDPSKFDALFIDALAARMAAELAYPLTGSVSQSQTMFQIYKQKLSDARTADGQEGTPEDIVADEFVVSRY